MHGETIKKKSFYLSLTTNLNLIFRIIKLIWLLTDPSLGCKEMKEIHLNHYRYLPGGRAARAWH
jgi:hypothetical protein